MVYGKILKNADSKAIAKELKKLVEPVKIVYFTQEMNNAIFLYKTYELLQEVTELFRQTPV